MSETMQFSMRIEPELVRRIDEEAEREFKSRTELIKEAVTRLLREREGSERLKKVAAELWLRGELPQAKAKKVLSDEEFKDLEFGKKWIEDALHEISS